MFVKWTKQPKHLVHIWLRSDFLDTFKWLLNERTHSFESPDISVITWISWMVALNWGERSLHCFSSSIALSKFFTYSAYILRKGVSFCRISPIRGVDALQGGRGRDRSVTPNVKKREHSWTGCRPASDWRSPFSHALLQIREKKLTVEGVNGGDIGEDVLHDIDKERPLVCLLH